MFEGPVEGVDFHLSRHPYFSTPFVVIAKCLHPDCPYDTGKTYETREALKSYGRHWHATHTDSTAQAS